MLYMHSPVGSRRFKELVRYCFLNVYSRKMTIYQWLWRYVECKHIRPVNVLWGIQNCLWMQMFLSQRPKTGYNMYIRMQWFSRFNSSMHFLDRNWFLKPNSIKWFPLFSAFVLRISYFCDNYMTSQTEIFFLEIGQFGCQKIQTYMLISDLKERFSKTPVENS